MAKPAQQHNHKAKEGCSTKPIGDTRPNGNEQPNGDAGEPSDASLLQHYANGDMSAFERLYRRHKDSLYGFLLRQLSGHLPVQHIDELTQEIWTVVIVQADSFRHQSGFKTWLFAIARNKAADYWRKPALVSSGQDPDSQPTTEQEPATAHQQQRLQERVRHCLGRLPHHQREAVLLRETGLTVQNLAEVVDVGFETAKSRLKLAYQHLRQCLEVVMSGGRL